MIRDLNTTSAVEIKWRVHPAKCTGCGDCVAICPVGALKVKDKIAIMVDPNSCCRESCRICEYHCYKEAIRAY